MLQFALWLYIYELISLASNDLRDNQQFDTATCTAIVASRKYL